MYLLVNLFIKLSMVQDALGFTSPWKFFDGPRLRTAAAEIHI